jgi:hypothetical protein
MSLGDILGIVAIAVGVVAIIVGVLAARRWGNRRMRLGFECRSTPLLPLGTSTGQDLLKVTYRDFEVPDPHLVTINLRNVGPGDIASKRFDNGDPLILDLQCTMYGVTAASHPESTESTAVGAPAVIKIRPMLIPKGESIVVEAVVSGSASPDLLNPLVDTDLVPSTEPISEALLDVLAAALLRTVRLYT